MKTTLLSVAKITKTKLKNPNKRTGNMDFQMQLFFEKNYIMPNIKVLGVVSGVQTETTSTPLTAI